jgi:hypothetical protein
LAEPIVATVLSLLLHGPEPEAVLLSVVVAPAQILNVPVIDGVLLTVTTAVAKPPDAAYVMVALPVAIPVTTPDPSIVATEVLLLLHVPPLSELLRVLVPPTHMLSVPEMAGTRAFTVTV